MRDAKLGKNPEIESKKAHPHPQFEWMARFGAMRWQK
jgi:hypothetical protein